MKLDITKACADSLRAFTQNHYGIQLKSSHAHELVAAYFGYASRAALLADENFSMDNLTDTEIIILNSQTLLIDHRRKSLENLPAELPSSSILAEGIYTPIVTDEQFSKKIWPDFRVLAIALAQERADTFRMFGSSKRIEMDRMTDIVIQTTESEVTINVIFDYPSNSKKRIRDVEVEITLTRIAGAIGYTKREVNPIFYYGGAGDPDVRLKFGLV